MISSRKWNVHKTMYYYEIALFTTINMRLTRTTVLSRPPEGSVLLRARPIILTRYLQRSCVSVRHSGCGVIFSRRLANRRHDSAPRVTTDINLLLENGVGVSARDDFGNGALTPGEEMIWQEWRVSKKKRRHLFPFLFVVITIYYVYSVLW